MKKIKTIFVFISACLLFVSCKKDNKKDNNPSVKLQKVTFQLGFSQTTTGIGASASRLKINSTTPDTSLTNHIDVIYYMVFDANGNNLHNITQSASDTAFGHYTDNLQAGQYTVAIAAGKSGLVINPGTLTNQFIYYQVSKPFVSDEPIPGPFDKDAFFYRNTLTVANTSATLNVNLTRLVSKLVVNIKDAIPANATRAELTLNYYQNTYFVGDGHSGLFTLASEGFGRSTIYNYSVQNSDWGKTNYQLSTLFLPNTGPMSVDILISTNTVVQGEKLVNNVTGQPNKVTLLSGNLFGGSSGGGFQVGVDTTFNTPIVRTFP